MTFYFASPPNTLTEMGGFLKISNFNYILKEDNLKFFSEVGSASQ